MPEPEKPELETAVHAGEVMGFLCGLLYPEGSQAARYRDASLAWVRDADNRIAELESRLARWGAIVRAAAKWWQADRKEASAVTLYEAADCLTELASAMNALSEQERSEILREDESNG